MMLKFKTLVIAGGFAVALGALSGPALADGSASMRVGDMAYGNGLDPTGWSPLLWPKDPKGFSYLHEGMKRTPSGVLYDFPPQRSDDIPDPDSDQWYGLGVLQLGYLAVMGDDNALFFRQYSDWSDGLILGLMALNYYQPSTARFVDVRASYVGDDDYFLRVRAGRLGKYRVEAFARDMPHTVATNAYPFWDGVGSMYLSVPDGLEPGESTVAEVAAAARSRPRQDIRLVRTRTGLSLESSLTKKMTVFGSVVNEERNGTRLWGGSMFFNYPFPDNGGVLETVRPIDFTTTDITLGLRWVGDVWRFNSVYSGSFFRNHKDHLQWESPFDLWNVVGTPAVGNIYLGEWSLEPDNDYHNLRLELARSLPNHGDLSFALAWGTMRQNDALRAPVTCTGLGGIYIAPPADFTFKCADWNTPAALSRQTAEARIDTALFYARIGFRPSSAFGWHAKLRWYQENNKTDYLSYNPLTGQYGYISENGSQGTIVPGETGIFDPNNPLFWSYNAMIRNVPFEYEQGKLEFGIDWRVSDSNSLDATYSFQRRKPGHRERDRLDEHRLELSWVSRELGGGTLRASMELASRTGDDYNYDPYDAYYAESLPGFVMPENGLHALTTSAMRKYDMADRRQVKWRAIYIYPIGISATLSTTWYGHNNNYDAPIGQQSNHAQGIAVSWDWQPKPQTSVGAWLGYDRAHIAFSNVADNETLFGQPGQEDPSLGGPLYPYANQWWGNTEARNFNAGVTYRHDFGNGMHLDAAWSLVYTRSELDETAASPSAVAGPQQPFFQGPSVDFPANFYRRNTFELGLSVPLTQRVGLRIFGRYWGGSFFDWHYLGLEDNPIIDHRIYTDRGPNGDYSVSVLGVMVTVGL